MLLLCLPLQLNARRLLTPVKALLVKTFGPDDHPYVVDTCVLRNVDLLFKLVGFMNRFKNLSFGIIRILISSAGEEIALF